MPPYTTLATEKSRYFAQPRPIIANYYCNEFTFLLIGFTKQEMVQEMSCSLDFVYCTSYIKYLLRFEIVCQTV